jgi:hypothetical protein
MSWRDLQLTERQRAGVRLIRNELGINADPRTRGEASDHLDKHLAAAKRSLSDGMDWSYFDDDNPGGKYGS